MNDTRAFRECFGRFATGVTVVTCVDAQQRPCGITANSFSSVSLAPPLVLWSIGKESNSLQAYLNAQYFAINVLASHQHALSAHFAQSDHTLFDSVEYTMSGNGVPLLPNSLATFECRTHQTYDCGDHHIIVGEVLNLASDAGDPLLFYRGEYRELRE
tara:strand:+ start:7675 stop:8148 length:474 start_codon:yes stop_codon:yes gene_type:complete